MSASLDFVAEATGGGVVVNIGQLDAATKRQLEKAVRAGVISKWRGYWYPVAGAAYGLGQLKTCYGRKP